MPTVKPLTFEQLKKKAQEKNIPFWGKTRAQLLIDLGEENSDIFVVDRAADFTREELLDLKREERTIPGKTIGYKKDQKIIEEYLAYNDLAFNNCDLTDTKARVRHIFGTKDVVCDCGEKFRIERRYKTRIGGGFGQIAKDESQKIVVEEAVIRLCPTCGKKWIYHDMNTAKAASGKYVP